MSKNTVPHGIGLFLIAATTIMFELILTRVFSVTLWYHFSFMAISLAMLGLTIGSIAVFVFPGTFAETHLVRNLVRCSFAFSLSLGLCYMAQLQLGAVFTGSVFGFVSTFLFLVLVTAPFVLSGICISLLLTTYVDSIPLMYAFDLVGAGTGCLLVVALLSAMDPTSAIVATAVLAQIASLVFALTVSDAGEEPIRKGWHYGALAACIGFFFLSLQNGGVSFAYTKGFKDEPHIFTGWNTFSRVTVSARGRNPVWMAAYRGPAIDSRAITIDAVAGTDVLRSDGDFSKLDYLGSDITSPVYYLRPAARVLVLGCGGGRDVATALHFGNTDVTSVEMNDIILSLLRGPLLNFSGHLSEKATLVMDEARSFLSRQTRSYDIIQMSLIDTTAAVASGAYLLSEHSLYTRQAWVSIFSHLTTSGIFSVTRNRYRGWPLEVDRCLTLAITALRDLGVKDPRKHILMFEGIGEPSPDPNVPSGMVTVLVSPGVFSAQDIEAARKVQAKLGFRVVYDGSDGEDPFVRKLLDPATYEEAVREAPVDISPPTDDKPFFFFELKPDEIWHGLQQGDFGAMFYHKAVGVLLQLFVIVSLLVVACIILPLRLRHKRPSPLFAMYFAGIGVAYMLIEMALLQILSLYLGHPIYSLLVVLSSLLIATGLGSLATRRFITERSHGPHLLVPLGLLILVASATAAVYPTLLDTAGVPMANRILTSLCMCIPLGLLMGTPFPIGFSVLGKVDVEYSPWCWGINGAASVLASIVSIILALLWGLKLVFLIGIGFYVLTFVTFLLILRRFSTA